MTEATQSLGVVLKEVLSTLKEIELTTKKININLEIIRDLNRKNDNQDRNQTSNNNFIDAGRSLHQL